MTVLRDYATALAQPTLPLGPDDLIRYDEVVAPDGSFRPAWKAMAAPALALTPRELRRVGGEISRFLADDGVTYVPRGVRASAGAAIAFQAGRNEPSGATTSS